MSRQRTPEEASRNARIKQAREDGTSLADIATQFGISPGRVSQIANDPDSHIATSAAFPSKSSWQAVAHQLAERLSYAACLDHDPPAPHDCPHCADVAAYQAYVAKCQRSGVPAAGLRTAEGAAITLEDLFEVGPLRLVQ